MNININDYIAVRLSKSGQKAWEEDWGNTPYRVVPDEVRRAATLPDGRVKVSVLARNALVRPTVLFGQSEPVRWGH